jgi:hypothetical protein
MDKNTQEAIQKACDNCKDCDCKTVDKESLARSLEQKKASIHAKMVTK